MCKRKHGTTILREDRQGDSPIWYLYDGADDIIGFEYQDQTYYYLKNLQGDVLQILDGSGNTIVEYMYDSWGKVVSVTGTQAETIGQRNPFRYGSYYYDIETGLYYLNSRYYDPEVGRFINADDISMTVATPENPNWDKNLYAYSDNNPVNRNDNEGAFWHIVAGAAISALVNGVAQLATNLLTKENWYDGLGTAMVAGAVTGGFAAGTGSILANTIVGATTSLVNLQ